MDQEEDSTVQTISERTALYRQALSEAESASDVSKVRRYKRGLESLTEMMKSARAKRPVNLDDLPPVVVVKGATSTAQVMHLRGVAGQMVTLRSVIRAAICSEG